MRVLMVCTGNICRSPTAAAVFDHLAKEMQLGKDVRADSCGLHGYHVGERPDARAVATAKSHGIHVPPTPARQIQPEDFAAFELIPAMDRGHLSQLNRRCPPAYAHKLRLFLEAVPDTIDVPDPYYGSARDFEHALELIEAGARAWLAQIAKSNQLRRT